MLLSASLDACDNFSFPFVVVSLSMPQIRGSCGHLKGNYDNHFSCLNCSGCSRFNCCAVCHCWSYSTWVLVGRRRLFRDRQMGKTKEAKVKKQKSFASRSSSSSRPGLEQTVSQVDPPGSTSADGLDDDAASVLSRISLGVSRYAGTPSFPAVDAYTEHRVLSLKLDDQTNVPPLPDPKPVIWLVSMGFRLYRS